MFIYMKAEFLIYWCIYDSSDVASHAPAAKWTSLLCLICHMVRDRLQNSIQAKWKYCQASPNEKQHSCHSSLSVHFSASCTRLLLLSVRKHVRWSDIFVHFGHWLYQNQGNYKKDSSVIWNTTFKRSQQEISSSQYWSFSTSYTVVMMCHISFCTTANVLRNTILKYWKINSWISLVNSVRRKNAKLDFLYPNAH